MIRESDKDETKGRVKEATGSLAGDDDMKREGKADQASATAKDKTEKAKDAVGDGIDKVKGAFKKD